MSQAGSNSGGGGGGGSSINQINTQNGNATPLANIVIANGVDLTDLEALAITAPFNLSTIQAYGGVIGTATQNKFDIVLPNHFHSQTSPGVPGSVTTTNDTPTTIATCPMSVNPAVYQFVVHVVAYDVTDNSGASVVGTVSFLSNGGPPDVLGPDDFIEQQSAGGTFPAATAITLQGTATTFNVIVTGVNGKTIRWLCHGTYTVVT